MTTTTDNANRISQAISSIRKVYSQPNWTVWADDWIAGVDRSAEHAEDAWDAATDDYNYQEEADSDLGRVAAAVAGAAESWARGEDRAQERIDDAAFMAERV